MNRTKWIHFLADKILIIVFLCMIFVSEYVWVPAGLLVVMEGIRGLAQRRNYMTQYWFDYLRDCLLFSAAGVLLFRPQVTVNGQNIAMVLLAIVILFSALMHISIARAKKRGLARGDIDGGVIRRSLFISVAGMLLYIIIGATVPYLFQKADVSDSYKEQYAQMLEVFEGEEQTENYVSLIPTNEEALRIRIRMIEAAESEIILSTFDIRSDESGTDVLSLLYAAAERGVSVKLLVDGFSDVLSMEGNPKFQALASHPNAEVKIYNPVNLLMPWTMMGRLHDKYLIVDGSMYLMGGRNSYDYFLGSYDAKRYNDDMEVLICSVSQSSGAETEDSETPQAESVMQRQFAVYFERMWNQFCSKKYLRTENLGRVANRPSVRYAAEKLLQHYENMQKEGAAYADCFGEYEFINEHSYLADNIMLLTNELTPDCKEPVLLYELTELMCAAEERVVIHTPYAICNQTMYESLCRVSDTVGDTTLVLNSVANGKNLFGSGDYLYHKQELIDTGVTLLEYEGGDSYHAKMLLIDEDISIIGSFNWDMRSVYLDTELMLVIRSEEFAAEVETYMDGIHEQSRKVVSVAEYDEEYGCADTEAEPIEWTRLLLLQLVGTLGGLVRFLA